MATTSAEPPQRHPSNANTRLFETLKQIRSSQGNRLMDILPNAMKREASYPALAYQQALVLLSRMIDAAEREIRETIPEVSLEVHLLPFPKLREWLMPHSMITGWAQSRNNFSDADMKSLEMTGHFVTNVRPEYSLLDPELQDLSASLDELIEETERLTVPNDAKLFILTRIGELKSAIADYRYLGPEVIARATDAMVGVYGMNSALIKQAEEPHIPERNTAAKSDGRFSKRFFEVVKKANTLVATANNIYTLLHHALPAAQHIAHITGYLVG